MKNNLGAELVSDLLQDDEHAKVYFQNNPQMMQELKR